MEALQSIGQFFARWLAQLETTFVEKQRYLLLVDGLKNTLIITAGALVIGVVIGSLVAMIKYCGQDSRLLRPLCWLCSVYITVIRGVPVVVQLLIFYFLILKSSDGLVVGIVTFGINSGAYVAELVRSGIAAVDPGQMEAGRSLGLSYPGIRDAQEALLRGEIDRATFLAVDKAHREGRRPPWGSPLGGEIYIHEGGSHCDWTQGCIALDASDMDRLFPLRDRLEAVEIRP